MKSQAKLKIAAVLADALKRLCIEDQTIDRNLEIFDPEGEDDYIDINWKGFEFRINVNGPF
jgi:hypothetical protein